MTLEHPDILFPDRVEKTEHENLTWNCVKCDKYGIKLNRACPKCGRWYND